MEDWRAQGSFNSENRHQVKISVCEPRVVDKIKKHVIYSVKGVDRDGTFEVYRRYSEFSQLRALLISRWPGCYIPPLPPKQVINNLEDKFVEERQKYLERFCNAIAELPYLYYSNEFKVFLRSSSADISKELSSLPKESYNDLIKKYSEAFSALAGKEIGPEVQTKLEEFGKFLKKVIPLLETLKKVAKNVTAARKGYAEQYHVLVNYLIPEYEKVVVAEVAPNNALIFSSTSVDKLLGAMQRLKEDAERNSWESVYMLVKSELREVQAMQEAIKAKAYYDDLKAKAIAKEASENLEITKLKSGGSTLRSVFSRRPNGDLITDLENSVVQIKKDIESLTTISDIIVCVLGYIEIEGFKRARVEKYNTIIQGLALEELGHAERLKELWTVVSTMKPI